MQGLMMDRPLLVSGLIEHAERFHGGTEIVSKTVEGAVHRYGYRDAHSRAKRVAKALKSLNHEFPLPSRHQYGDGVGAGLHAG